MKIRFPQIILAISLFTMISACDQIDFSKISDADIARIANNTIVCEKPYMRYASGCCIDQDANHICDGDELTPTPPTPQETDDDNGSNITSETPKIIRGPGFTVQQYRSDYSQVNIIQNGNLSILAPQPGPDNLITIEPGGEAEALAYLKSKRTKVAFITVADLALGQYLRKAGNISTFVKFSQNPGK